MNQQELDQHYAAAYAAHYEDRDLGHALPLYTAIIEAAPESPEAGYCRVQLHNIANRVVPKPELLAAAVELARVHLHLDAPAMDETATPTEAPAPGEVAGA